MLFTKEGKAFFRDKFESGSNLMNNNDDDEKSFSVSFLNSKIFASTTP